MRRQLDHAAQHFAVTVVGKPIFGWHDQTISSRTHDDRWLRVSWSQVQWTDGEWWTGNVDAASITGVPKPTVLDTYDWTVSGDDWECRNRAELMTLIEDKACSRTSDLRTEVDLPRQWWISLRHALSNLAKQPTQRSHRSAESWITHLEEAYGRRLALATPELCTEHTDLHWANVTQPHLYILDWEYWGRAPIGYGAATLYLHSLLVPNTAARVRAEFADLLDTPTGQVAQLAAGTHILSRAFRFEDYQHLEPVVRDHVHRLLSVTEV